MMGACRLLGGMWVRTCAPRRSPPPVPSIPANTNRAGGSCCSCCSCSSQSTAAVTAAPCDMPCRSSVASSAVLVAAAPYTPLAVACYGVAKPVQKLVELMPELEYELAVVMELLSLFVSLVVQ